ncbi:Rieske (2Fe-2S) protein [Flavobacterium sp.]|jgi:nitrite reductase/ring-hydroxylating ferredoxin subunit|uniref:Rieske (2Fe-2S) protein n=1 Tax=Flavobacterium sp. TaxID=239 RepID=UPI0037BE4976
MKKYFLLLIAFPMLFGCDSNSPVNNNPYLPNYSVNVEINMNLPAYSLLRSVANAIYFPNEGVRGIFVFNSGSGYLAFDAACPNQALSSCSTMNFKKLDPVDPLKIDKTNVVCPCDGAEYSLFSGQSKGKQYALKQYRVEVIGDVLRVYN